MKRKKSCYSSKNRILVSIDLHTINMIGSYGETYFAKQNRSDKEKPYEEVYYYLYLYEEFQNNFFEFKKVRFEHICLGPAECIALYLILVTIMSHLHSLAFTLFKYSSVVLSQFF